jgi:hypothetical protein
MQPGGLGGAFGMLGAVVGPVMMVALALQKPGPVRTLAKAAADSPERARKPATLGLGEPVLAPLVRAGVVVREPDGRVWLDARGARALLRHHQLAHLCRRREIGIGAAGTAHGCAGCEARSCRRRPHGLIATRSRAARATALADTDGGQRDL